MKVENIKTLFTKYNGKWIRGSYHITCYDEESYIKACKDAGIEEQDIFTVFTDVDFVKINAEYDGGRYGYKENCDEDEIDYADFEYNYDQELGA